MSKKPNAPKGAEMGRVKQTDRILNPGEQSVIVKVDANVFRQVVKTKALERHDVRVTEVVRGGGGGRGGRGRGGGRENVPPPQPGGLPAYVSKKKSREAVTAALRNTRNWCYDDKAILVTNIGTKINLEKTVNCGPAKFTVTITWQNTFNIRYDTAENQKESDQLLNLVWREANLQNAELIGSSYFPLLASQFFDFSNKPNMAHALRGSILRYGIFQVSQFIKKIEANGQERLEPVICINAQGCLGIGPQALSKLIEKMTGVTPEKLRRSQNPQHISGLQNLVGVKFELNYLKDRQGRPEKRTKKVEFIDVNLTAATSRFDCGGTQVSVADYFLKQYNKRLLHAEDWPLVCINTKRRTYVPLEVCEVVLQKPLDKFLEDLRPGKRPDPKIRWLSDVGDTMAMAPGKRRKLIEHFAQTHYEGNSILQHYGITFDKEMRSVPAIVLPTPKALYGKDTLAAIADGTWESIEEPYVEVRALEHWVMAYSKNPPGLVDDVPVKKVIAEMQNAAARHGMRLSEPIRVLEYQYDTVGKVYDLMRQHLPNAQFVMFITTRRDLAVVKTKVKQLFDPWIPSGHMVAENTPILNGDERGVRQHFSNIMAKINPKLEGVNHNVVRDKILTEHSMHKGLEVPNPLARLLKEDLAVLGADVCHPGASREGKNPLPSLVGAVASWDGKMGSWKAALRAQGAREEIIADMQGIIGDLFRSRDSQWPKNVLYIRDGVSEGQFDKVLQQEALSIEAAYVARGFAKPNITVIISSKRVKTRFFPNQPTDENTNVPPGLVVFDDLLQADGKYKNFYMVSHAGIKGTSNPCRYSIIRDDIAAQFGLTTYSWAYTLYDMCHLYSRCQRSVSYPAPAYYAHLLADRGRMLADKITRQYLDMSCLADNSNARETKQAAMMNEVKMKQMIGDINTIFHAVCDKQGFRQFYL